MNMKRQFTIIYSVFLGSILVACQAHIATNSLENISDTNYTTRIIDPTITASTTLSMASTNQGSLGKLPSDWEHRFLDYLNTDGMVDGNASPNGSLGLAIIAYPTTTQSIAIQVQTLVEPLKLFTYNVESDPLISYMEYFKSWSPDNKTVLVRSHDSTNDCIYGLVAYTPDVETNELHRIELKPDNEKRIYCSLKEAAWSPDGSQLVVFSDFASSLFSMDTAGNVLHIIPIGLENGDNFKGLQWTSQGIFFSVQNGNVSRLYQLQIKPDIQEQEIIFAEDARLTLVSLDSTGNRMLLNDSKSLQLIIYNVETDTIEKIIPDCIGHFDIWNNEPIEVPYAGINCFSSEYGKQLIFDWETESLTEFDGFSSLGWFTNLGGFLMEKKIDNDRILMRTIH